MIKKITMFVVTTCLIVSLAACSTQTGKAQATSKEEITHADLELFDYDNLKERAKLIVKATVEDDLTEQNSKFIYDNDDVDKPILDYYGLRNVKIEGIYKTDLKQTAGNLRVAEAAAVKDKTAYHYEDYEPMKKGETYILFLDNDTASGEWSIISCENGRVALDNIDATDEAFYGIAAKAMIEFETNLAAKEKNQLIDADITKAPDSEELEKSLETEDQKITIGYKKANKGHYEVQLQELK